ncbi:hypothetical protein ACFW04_002293 [Cataglyphis niger]
MISVQDQYFSLTRIFLLIVGLWPYQKSKLARFQFFCFFNIVITFIIFQLTTFITSKCTANFVIKVLSLVFIFICIIIKYYSFCINSETVILFVCSIFIVTDIQVWPDILQIISFSNASQQRHLHILTEYFVDQEKYYYYLLLHINTAICIGFVVLVATGSMFIAYFQYMCAMFTIASYRIENAIKIQISHNIIKHNKNLIHKSIKSAVDIHRKAIALCIDLISKFEMSFFFLIIFGVMTLSLNMFRIASSTCNTDELSLSFIVGFISLIYMFIANLVGQEITDHYNYIYVAAYKIRWYIAPPYIQKLILILLQRGNKSFGLNIGGLFTASIQCFTTLANTSLSYFTVMYSVRQ